MKLINTAPLKDGGFVQEILLVARMARLAKLPQWEEISYAVFLGEVAAASPGSLRLPEHTQASLAEEARYWRMPEHAVLLAGMAPPAFERIAAELRGAGPPYPGVESIIEVLMDGLRLEHSEQDRKIFFCRLMIHLCCVAVSTQVMFETLAQESPRKLDGPPPWEAIVSRLGAAAAYALGRERSLDAARSLEGLTDVASLAHLHLILETEGRGIRA